MNFTYRCFGLQLSADRQLSILEEEPIQKVDCRISIRDDLASQEDNFSVIKISDSWKVKIPGIAFFSVGRDRIEISLQNKLDSCLPFLFGGPMAKLLENQGKAAFRASGVALGDRALVIAGHGASGKSTLAATLGSLGYKVICDDLCAVSLKNQTLVTHPGERAHRLWEHSLDLLRLQPHSGTPIREQVRRFYHPFLHFCQRDLAIRDFLLLEVQSQSRRQPEVKRLGRQRGIIDTLNQLYLSERQSKRLGFEMLAPVSSALRFWHLTRPRNNCPKQLAELVLRTLS